MADNTPTVDDIAGRQPRSPSNPVGGGQSSFAAPPSFGAAPQLGQGGLKWSAADQARYGLDFNQANVKVRESPKVGYGFNARAAERGVDLAEQVNGGPLDETARAMVGAAEGAQYDGMITTGAVMMRLSEMTRPELTVLQQKLQKAGYYGNMKPENIRFGTVDTATTQAFSELLLDASRTSEGDTPWTDFLQRAVDEAPEAAGPTPLTSDDTRVNLWQVFREAIGREPNEQEIADFTARLNKRGTKAAGGWDSGTVSLEALQFARENNSAEYDGYQLISRVFPAIEKALGTTGGSRQYGG